MQISEMFKSCQGEGIHAGLPTVFVRLSGCNLYPNGCVWCDTKYAQGSNGQKISVEGVVWRVEELLDGCRRVCLTGGEPLHQADELCDLVDRLKFRDLIVEVFTNATLRPPSFFFLVDSWAVDIKCPSSGVSDRCLTDPWLETLRPCDLVKFVVSDSLDLYYVVNVLGRTKTNAQVALSPMISDSPNILFGDVLMSQCRWLQTVWEFCVGHNLRYSFQTHKLVFGNKRGV